MAQYILENDILAATFDTFGAELISVISKSNNREYIWNGDPSAWKRHSPVLFPIVGRYRDNTSIYNGNIYNISQHGFARDMVFEVTSITSNKIWFTLHDNNITLEKYPFSFKLECGYELIENQLTVIWKVTNTNDSTMYFSIGGHPAFAAPVGRDSMSGCKVLFDTDKDSLTYSLLNSDGCLANELHSMSLTNNCREITNDMFEQDAIIIENNQSNKVSLIDDTNTKFITVEFTAPLFGLWSPVGKNVPFICIEPWYGRSDREDYDCILENREWSNRLTPHAVFDEHYTITFN